MSASAFTPSTTTVTNNVPVNVPVVTAWEAYTPTFNGFGTATGIDAKWRRVGSSLQAQIKFTSGTLTAVTARISIPAGLTIESSAQNKIVGTAATQRTTTSGMPNIALLFVETSQTTNISFTNVADGGVKNLSAIDATVLFASSVAQSVEFEVPIAEWAGSGTTTLATRAVEEYLSTTSFSSLNVNRGPNGATLPTTTPAGTFESISFGPNPWQTTWLPTDIVSIEVDPFGNGKWTSIAGSIDVVSLTVQESSTTYIGLGFYFDGTNWVLIRGKYRNPNSTNGVWSAIGAGFRYRIKKVSSGAQVGYPVSARNIVGDTSGSVVPVGMLGERIVSSTISIPAAASNTVSTITGLTLPLTPGIWLITLNGSFFSGSIPTVNSSGFMGFSTDSGANSFSDRSDQVNNALGEPATANQGISLSVTNSVIISSNTIYYGKYRIAYTGTAPTINAKLIAIRIA